MELKISLKGIDAVDFFGVQNKNLNFLTTFFPKVRVVARGNDLILYGSEADVLELNTVVERLLEYFNYHNSINISVIEEIVFGNADTLVFSKQKEEVIVFGDKGKVIKPRTVHQYELVKSAKKNDLVFAIGPAGTGKTYIAIALAVKAFKERKVRKIILTRPAVEAGEQLGFLPGDMKEKLDPYLQPLYDGLADMLPKKKLEEMYDERLIEVAPLAYMRGRTLENAYVILDEAQNTSDSQLKMFLTRMGQNSKFIVTGDITQIDLPRHKKSGLIHAMSLFRGIDGIDFVFFDKGDVVRHPIVRKIIDAYENDENVQE
jgi:phosphate starvation-inducible PhoH-like protein